MSATTAVAAIKARLTANWTATDIAWPFETFVPPVSANGDPAAYVYFDPETTTSDRLGVGALYDRTGRVCLDLLSPVGTGYETAAALRAALTTIFADQQFSGLRTEVEEDVADAGKDSAGAYNVSYIVVRWKEWGGA